MKLIMCQYTSFLALLLAIAMLLSACSNDDSNEAPNPSDDSSEIRMNASVWQVMPGTRATTFSSAADLQTEGSFTCAVYDANTTTAYISPTQVNWVTSEWLFSDGKHYWPASGSLDFFAYMPVAGSLPSYITAGPSYTTARSPQFTCTNLPMKYDSSAPAADQGTGLQEFVWALVTNQNKAGQGASGVTLNFKHPFARIKFQLKENHPDIKINSITLKGLKKGGVCSFDGTTSTWTNLTPADETVDFVMTLKGDAATFNSNPADATVPIGSYSESAHQSVDILMVPQDFAGNITVNATWIDWGAELTHTVTASVPTTWAAGNSYTYTFTITTTDLIVNTSKYTEQW